MARPAPDKSDFSTHKFPNHAGFLTQERSVPGNNAWPGFVVFLRPKRHRALLQFTDLGLSKHILNAIEAEGYTVPTPIQSQAIPLAIAGHDIVGLAQTGTGKTAAFGLPIIEKLMIDHKKPEPKAVRALILAPTRELVNQIATNLRIFTRNSRSRSLLLSAARRSRSR